MSRNTGSTIVRILAWCVLAPGLFSIALSLWFASRSYGFGMESAKGRVISKSTARLTDVQGRVRFRDHALVEFTTRDGRRVVFRDPMGGAPLPYKVGSTVRVRYDPANPEKAIVLATSITGLLMSSFGILGGIGFVALGGLLLLAARLPWQMK